MECPNCQSISSDDAIECAFCNYVLKKVPEPVAEAVSPDGELGPPGVSDCPKCGAVNPVGAASCAMCAASLSESAAEQTPEPSAAPEPQTEAPSLETPAPEPAALEPSAASAPPTDAPQPNAAPAAPKGDADGAPIECPSCSYANPPGSLTCEMCSFIMTMVPTKMAPPIVQEDPPPPPPEPAPSKPKKKQDDPPPDQQIPLGRFPQKIPLSRRRKPRTVTCPNCNGENEPDAPFCTLCQFVLTPVTDRPKIEKQTPIRAEPEAPPAESGPRPEDAAIEDLKQKTPIPTIEPEPVPEPVRSESSPDELSGRNLKTPLPEEPQPAPQPELEPEPEPEPDIKPHLETPARTSANFIPERAEVPAAAAEPPRAKRNRPRKSRPFVLIADGDYVIRDELTAFLEGKGVKWISDAGNAEETLIQTQTLSVEIVIIDIKIPGAADGASALKKFRESQFIDNELPIIFMSSLSPEETKTQLPGNDPNVLVVAKPVDKELLWKRIIELTGDALRPV